MSRNLTLGLLIGIIVVHILLAANYAVSTPYRQKGALLGQGKPRVINDIGAPDERQHVNYIRHLIAGKGLPVFNPKDPDLYESYQSHQPPAFYVLGDVWCQLLGATHLDQKDDGLKLRALNVVLGAGTVAGVFFLAFWGFRNPEVALAAAAFTAFLPMFTSLSGAVSNDPMLILLCTWILAVTALCLRESWTLERIAVIGVLTGLALLTKTTALAIVPVLILATFLPQEKDLPYEVQPDEPMSSALAGVDAMRRPKPAFQMMILAAVIALVMVGPWWYRNQNLYQDPLAIKAFNSAFTNSAQKSQIIALIQAENGGGTGEISYWTDWVGWWTSRSFFGVFGYMDIWMNERGTAFTGASKNGAAPNTLYRLLLAVTVLCVLGWMIALTKEEWKETKSVQIMNAAFAVVILLLFLRFNMQYFQAQARYLYPAIGPIACGVAIGAYQLLGRFQRFAFPALALVFLAVNYIAVSGLSGEFDKRIEAANHIE
jgi:4-amino-4-deoxy-L-arabinose transferase-like glycosyltransferase